MRKIALLASVFCLFSCSSYYTSNGEHTYLHSKNGAMVVVPPGLTDENISHFHDLPEQSADPHVSIKPPPRA